MAQQIPTTFAEMTPEWLTATLAETGAIEPGSRVASASHEILGTGEGFIGEIARFSLAYDGEAGPATVVVKIPISIEENQQTGQLLGVYEREIRAYAELLPGLEVPTPKLLAAVIDESFDGVPDYERALKGEKLPVWLLRRIIRMELKGSQAPACVLILEDLSHTQLGDQLEGCDLGRAAEVLAMLARFHASGWGPRCPEPRHWLTTSHVVPKAFHAGYLNGAKGFRELAEPVMSDHALTLLRRVRRDGRKRITRLHETAPSCVLHGDFRLDNMFFDDDGTVRALFDWQVPYLGPGALDVAYFLGGSLDPSVDQGEIDELLALYHRGLVDGGVSGYTFGQLDGDYRQALLVLLHRFPLLENLEFGDDRGPALIQSWLRRFDARLARLA